MTNHFALISALNYLLNGKRFTGAGALPSGNVYIGIERIFNRLGLCMCVQVGVVRDGTHSVL